MNIHCRQAHPRELSILNQFQRGIIQAEAPYIPRRKNTDYHYYDIAQLLEDKEVMVAVAEHDGYIIGSGYAKKVISRPYLEHDFHAYIGFMYVRPEYRGQGVAQRILDFLSGWAKSQGIDELRLDVFAENAVAVQAYQKAGFEPNLLEMRLQIDE